MLPPPPLWRGCVVDAPPLLYYIFRGFFFFSFFVSNRLPSVELSNRRPRSLFFYLPAAFATFAPPPRGFLDYNKAREKEEKKKTNKFRIFPSAQNRSTVISCYSRRVKRTSRFIIIIIIFYFPSPCIVPVKLSRYFRNLKIPPAAWFNRHYLRLME